MGHKSSSSRDWLARQEAGEILATRQARKALPLSTAAHYAVLEGGVGQGSEPLGAHAYRCNKNIALPILRTRRVVVVR